MEGDKARTVIRRILRGTSFAVAFELDMVQYQHFLLAEGRRPGVSMPMDVNIMREMAALAAHFEGPKRAALPAEDEARDAAEFAGEA